MKNTRDQNPQIHKPRILFYVERDLHLPFLEPIHDYIATHYDMDLAFSSPEFRKPEGGMVGHGLDENNIARIKGKSKYFQNSESFRPDVTVVADACFYPIRNCGKIVNVGHGLISKGWFYTDSSVVRRENHADLVCVPGRKHKEILEKNVFSPINVTGFIKSDALYFCGEMERENFLTKYRIHENNRVVLFAPTFNDELSAIPCVKERISEVVDDNTILIIKLHSMTDRKWVIRYAELAQNENNIHLITDHDFSAAMVCSHVMVSDVSSAYVEFMLLDKPVVLFNNPLQKTYVQYNMDDIEYMVRDAGIQVGTVEEMKLAVKLSFADPHELKEKRNSYAEMINHNNIDGKCAERSAHAILDIINKKRTPVADDITFSVVVNWYHEPGDNEIRMTLKEILKKSEGLNIEIIFMTPESFNHNPFPEVSCWLSNSGSDAHNGQKVDEILNGDFVVFIAGGMIIPKYCFKWMYYYFKWHGNAGAVRALSTKDRYQEILNECPEEERPKTIPQIADYFHYVLMGNDIVSDDIPEDAECVMVPQTIFRKASSRISEFQASTFLQILSSLLKDEDLIVCNAVEVFIYPNDMIADEKYEDIHVIKDDDGNIPDFIAAALESKKKKDFLKAISFLEKAKDAIGNLHTESNNVKELHIMSLLKKSKVLKKENQFQKSIEYLEEAKKEIGSSMNQGEK